jgi:hypothetical protein
LELIQQLLHPVGGEKKEVKAPAAAASIDADEATDSTIDTHDSTEEI